MGASNTEQYVPSKKLTILGVLAKTFSTAKKEQEKAEAAENAQTAGMFKALLPTFLAQQGAMQRAQLTAGTAKSRLAFDIRKQIEQFDLDERKLTQSLDIVDKKIKADIAAGKLTREHEIERDKIEADLELNKFTRGLVLKADEAKKAHLRDMSKAIFTAGEAMKRTEADIAGRKEVAKMRIDAIDTAEEEEEDPHLKEVFAYLRAEALNEEQWLEVLGTNPNMLPLYKTRRNSLRALTDFINADRAKKKRPPIPYFGGQELEIEQDKWLGPIYRGLPIIGGGIKEKIVPTKKPTPALKGIIPPPKREVIETPPVPFRFEDQRTTFQEAFDKLAAMTEKQFKEAWPSRNRTLENAGMNENEREAIKEYILRRIKGK